MLKIWFQYLEMLADQSPQSNVFVLKELESPFDAVNWISENRKKVSIHCITDSEDELELVVKTQKKNKQAPIV